MRQRAAPAWAAPPRSALRRVRRWTSWLPAVFVSLYLGVLALAFLWLGRRIEARRIVIEQVIQPSRDRLVQMQRALALGIAASSAYAARPDPRFAASFLAADRQMRALERELAVYAGRLGRGVQQDLGRFIGVRERWAAPARALVTGASSPAEYRSRIVAHHDVMLDVATAAARLEAAFDAQSTQLMTQSGQIARVRRGLVGVAGLVALLAALVAALYGERNRRLTEALAVRAEQEASLRRIAATLTATEDLPAALTRIAEAAAATAGAEAAYIEHIAVGDARTAEVMAAVGRGAPPVGARHAYRGSGTEAASRSQGVRLVADLRSDEYGEGLCIGGPEGPCPALILSLRHNGSVQGALVVLLRGEEAPAVSHGAIKRLRILASLASLTLWRAALFQREREARDEAARLMEVAESKRRLLEAVVQQMPAGVIIVEAPTGRILIGNRQVDRIWRAPLSRAEHIEQYRPLRVLHADGRPYTRREMPLARSLEAGEVVEAEVMDIERGDGTRGTIRVSAAPVRDERGEIVAAVATFYDITRQRKLERGLRLLGEAGRVFSSSLDHEATLRSVVHLMVPEMADWCTVHLADPARGITYSVATAHADESKAALREELQRRFPFGLEAMQPIAEVIRTGEPRFTPDVDVEDVKRTVPDPAVQELVLRLCPRSGMVLPLRAGDRVLGALALAYAESGRRYDQDDFELAKELALRAALAVRNAQLYREAQEALRIREEVLAIVSHDLRNPLHTVEMTAAMLTELRLPAEEQAAHLEAILRATRHMDRLIQDLLDVTRIQAGKPLSIRPRAEPPARLVREAAEAFRAAAREKHLHLEVRAPDGLPFAHADPQRIHQVLSNLLSNAVKFTPEHGVVRISVGRTPEGLRFAVQDTGPGIAPEDVERIFQPFWQVSRTARLGTGLGLGIARGIVEQHGGRMHVESRPGAGSTFWFTLPLAREGRSRSRAA